VVETLGFNDAGWLDRAGHPRSESLRVTERFRRMDLGHMQFQITFEDPETLLRPLTISLPIQYLGIRRCWNLFAMKTSETESTSPAS
jgi:hypothetical protein